MITKEKKGEAIAKLARSKKDVGSPEVQVSILTERILEVTEHVKANKPILWLAVVLCRWLVSARNSSSILRKTISRLTKPPSLNSASANSKNHL